MNVRTTLALLASLGWAAGLSAQQPTLPAPLPGPELPAPTAPAPIAPIPLPNIVMVPASTPPAHPPPAAPPGPQIILSAEALYWFIKTPPTPPLLTSSDPAYSGVLGFPSTTVVTGGGGQQRYEAVSGARATARCLLDDLWGVRAGTFYLANGGRFDTYTRGILAIPFFDTSTQANSSIPIASPGSFNGWADVERFTVLWSIDASALLQLSVEPESPIDVVAGVRYLNLLERLRLRALTTRTAAGSFAGNPAAAGSTFVGQDYFATRNHFIGPHLAVNGSWNSGGKWWLDASFSLGVGMTQQQVDVSGYTNLGSPAQQSVTGFVFSQNSNIGRNTQSVFTYLPQARVAVGYQMFKAVRLTFGADVLYWSNVVRVNDQLDPSINSTQIPVLNTGRQQGPLLPGSGLRVGDFWAMGLTAGVDLAF